ncbi:MAG: YihY/virulence factor BrkB family protein [Desulfobacterales bacterium]|nr:YihY/virulence factor BrkB family protein [Desulfobacterales bacterium]MDX2512887.1 YihY/virulence factor BrkB family protein [Desulfobacterales bacterium]
MTILHKIIQFITIDIWHIETKNASWGRSFFLRQLRVIILAFRGFKEDKLQLRASALTLYSLLAIVPVLAMIFAIAKGFGFDTHLQDQLLTRFPGQQEVLVASIGFAKNLLAKTRGGLIAGIGIIVLYWAVIKVLGHIEESFNDIWNISKARSLWRKFSDYLTIMLICPVLVILSSSATVFIKTQITLIVDRIALLGFFSPLIYVSFKLIPYVLIWLLFTFIYMMMPNTKVRVSSGLLAGIVAGTIYQALQMVYINFQFLLSKSNAIYGSFAALPLFLIWLQASWLIVLFGAEIAFAHQNNETFEFEQATRQISFSLKKRLALQIAHLLVTNFAKAEKPFTAHQVSAAIEIPLRLVQMTLLDLVAAKIVSETDSDTEEEPAYQPALDINRITIGYVMNALERIGDDQLPSPHTSETDAITLAMAKIEKAIESHPDNRLLKDI